MRPIEPSPPEPRRGPVRDALAVLATALIGASLLKWFCIEAFSIPSPSMQPTLMGCVEAGVYDRVLVDKLRYSWRDPERWDLAAFRFPLQQREAVAKRVVGLPGERLRIVGGNPYRVHGEPGREVLEVLRKPEQLQRAMWREIYPARREVRGEQGMLSGSFRAEPPSAFVEQGDELHVMLREGQAARLTLADVDGGLVDRIWDGYPLVVAKVLREAYRDRSLLGEIVPDARIAFRLQAETEPARGAIALTVVRPELPLRGYRCEFAAGRAVLVVRGPDDELLLGSAPFDCRLGDGSELAFAHVDDELILWRDGVERARLDCSAFACREGCELPDPCGFGPALPTSSQQVTAHLELTGAGQAVLRDLRIWRDLHYTRGSLALDHVLDVPAGHYFVLGDNPLQSSDGRNWRALRLGVAADGTVQQPSASGVQLVRGNLDPGSADTAPRRDENPIAVAARGLLLMVDCFGESHALRCDRRLVMVDDEPMLVAGDDADSAGWRMPTERVPFVPREAFLGRALLIFWPVPPFGPWRFGGLR